MTDEVTLRYKHVEETLRCHEVTQSDGRTTLKGIPSGKTRRVDSEVFARARGGKHGEYHGVSQSMADPRCDRNEEFPMNWLPEDSDIEVVDITKDVEDDD
jgi:hypothetical protein